MKEKVYITGHHPPDTDSICSALAYAALKNRIGKVEAIPIRIGEINNETKFVLDYFQVEAPPYMQSMQPRISDLDLDHAYGISSNVTLERAMEIIDNNRLNGLTVVDDNENLIGIISVLDITKSYANVWDDTLLGRSHASLQNIVDVLSANILVQPEDPRPFSGPMQIYAMENMDKEAIHENDVVIVGDRKDSQDDIIKLGASLLILTNHSTLDEEQEAKARENQVTVISTGLSTMMTARILPHAVPVSYAMTSENLVAFYLNDLVDDVKAKMASTRYHAYPVLDSQGRVVASVSRYHLINFKKKKLILVDHSDVDQSIADLNRAQIVEIIDHHRIGDVETTTPIYYRNEPVGCTCTIISQMYVEQGIRPSPKIAGLMCSAIISDTLLFRSPTTTDKDRRAVQWLSTIAGIDPEKYAIEMFKAGTDLTMTKPTQIITQDVKYYNIEEVKIKIAQVFTINQEAVEMKRDRILKRMQELLNQQGEDTYILMVTNILEEYSTILLVGRYGQEIAQGFGKELSDNQSFTVPGLLSRKKQMIPVVTAAIARAKA